MVRGGGPKAIVPMAECVFQSALEHPNANAEKALDGVPAPSHLLMAEAIHYALGQWTELNVFCSDGAVAIDSNVSEREMKGVVLNRKNSLFVSNPRGGRTAAVLASLTSTCRRHDVDPQLDLTQLLTNLPQVRRSQLPDWLPDQWKLLQAAHLSNLQNPARLTS